MQDHVFLGNGGIANATDLLPQHGIVSQHGALRDDSVPLV